MPDRVERRQVPRIALVGRLKGQIEDGVSVWLADLSTTGARLTHFAPVHPGATLSLQLPPELDGVRLAARVAWTATYGTEQTPEGEHHAIYQSGVAFMQVTPEQRATLERLMDRFRRERPSGR